MRRIALTLEYEGSAFHGWQSQKNALAAQDVLAAKLKILLKEAVAVQGAGRTDAGVHAHGQVAAFSTRSDKECARILAGLNGLLPRDLRVRDCREVEAVFDPRRDAEGKTYRYVWWDGPALPPFWRRYAWHAGQPLDDKAMAEAAQCLEGEHDFSSFRAAGCSAKSPVRRMDDLRIVRKGQRLTLHISGTAFLHQMVRIIAGTLYEVGIGKRAASSLPGLLEARDRKLAGKTAPPQGLVLWEVRYGAIPRQGRKVLGKQHDSSTEKA